MLGFVCFQFVVLLNKRLLSLLVCLSRNMLGLAVCKTKAMQQVGHPFGCIFHPIFFVNICTDFLGRQILAICNYQHITGFAFLTPLGDLPFARPVLLMCVPSKLNVGHIQKMLVLTKDNFSICLPNYHLCTIFESDDKHSATCTKL